MTLRQRIKHELENFHSGVEYHVISPEQFNMALDAYTDRILTEVREALLRDEVVEAGARSLHSEEHLFVGEWEVPHELFDGRLIEDDDKEGYRFSSRRAITAALDAVTGEGDR